MSANEYVYSSLIIDAQLHNSITGTHCTESFVSTRNAGGRMYTAVLEIIA